MIQIISNENFWITLSFLTFLGITFSFVKRSVMKVVDGRIEMINKSVSEAQYMKDKAHAELINLKNDYQKTLEKNKELVEIAKSDAESIIKATEEQIKESNMIVEKLFLDYQKKAENRMIESLKNDVMITVISVIEEEIFNKNKTSQNTSQLENTRKMLKRFWN